MSMINDNSQVERERPEYALWYVLAVAVSIDWTKIPDRPVKNRQARLQVYPNKKAPFGASLQR